MILEFDNVKYEFTKKQFKVIKRLIKSNNFYATDFSYENNKKEYKQIMHKYNILPLEIYNG